MSDRPIAVGDLVQVVRGMLCCGTPTESQGMVFKVAAFLTSYPRHCAYCGVKNTHLVAAGCEGGKAFDLPRLKRIPPLSELESTDERAKEPA